MLLQFERESNELEPPGAQDKCQWRVESEE